MDDSPNVPVWCSLVCDKCHKDVAGEWTKGHHVPRLSLFDAAERVGVVVDDCDVYCSECAAEIGKTKP